MAERPPSSELPRLLGLDAGASRRAFAGAVDARIESLALPRPRTLLDAIDEENGEDDRREWLWWLLRMAIASYDRVLSPAPAPPLAAALAARLRARPSAQSEHAQMLIDDASVLRRARIAAAHAGAGGVFLLGDDDGTSLALATLGASPIHVADVDGALLAWLRREAPAIVTHRLDVFSDALPEALRARFDVVVTDPIRSFEPALAFLEVVRAALRPGGHLLWADHPDWNLEWPLLERALGAAGFASRGAHELLHRYPLDGAWVPADIEGVDIDGAWVEGLTRCVSGWSHLYLFRAGR